MSRIEEAIEKANRLRTLKISNNDTDSDRTITAEKTDSDNVLPLKPHQPDPINISNPLLVSVGGDPSPIAEEYRKLKSIIVSLTKQNGFYNTIMVTSSIGGEGKSITSLNLALSLAQEHDHTVLLVDADLRKPSLHSYLGLEPKVGLADCLMGHIDVSETLIKTGLGQLTLFPAGKQINNPVELFSSQKMRNLLDELKNRYRDRYIIIDSPPTLPFAETRLISKSVDGIIFVVKEGGPSLQNIKEALETFRESDVLGIVYNNATISSLNGGYHYYYHGYDYKNRSTDVPSQGKGFKSRVLPKMFKFSRNDR